MSTAGRGTLKEYLEADNGLWVVCSRGSQFQGDHPDHCRHEASIELALLIQRLGWNFNFDRDPYAVQAMLVCSKCGKRFPYIFMVPRRSRLLHPAATQMSGVATQGAGSAHSVGNAMSFEESLQYTLELNRRSRETNKTYYEAKGDRVGRVRKFGRRGGR